MGGAAEGGTGLLTGLRVLDLSIWRPGPYATQLLAEIGADVIKIEPPGGDPMRRYPELFVSLNANKRSIVLDLKDAADRARALDLAGEADVVVEGFRPGVTDRLGVGYGDVLAVNPTVIYCSVSGMGQDGPLAGLPGHDLNYQAWAGVLAPDGGPPVVPAVPLADLAGGMAAAFATWDSRNGWAVAPNCSHSSPAPSVDASVTRSSTRWRPPTFRWHPSSTAPRCSPSLTSASGRWPPPIHGPILRSGTPCASPRTPRRV